MHNEKQQNRDKKQNVVNFQSSIKIIGYYPPLKKLSLDVYMQNLQFDQNSKSFIPFSLAKTNISKSSSNYSKVPINPVKIYGQNNTIGVIDQNQNGWIMSQIFQCPINISILLKRKIQQMFINEKQAILKTKKGLILINWGAKKLIQNESLIKINLNDSKTFYQNFFEAFSILDGSANDTFHVTNLKKSQNSNKMYRVMNQGSQIFGYPTMEKFNKFQERIIGLSVGKYHSLCWDQNGQIYSWGTRTLGLGFDSLPDEDLINQPIKLNFSFKVKCAFASVHYSLALSTDGKLYQWGIRKEANQLNEELIFQPRPFVFKYFNCENKKFTCLKGKNKKFGIMCSSGDLYVWGEKARDFVNPSASIPKQWQNGRLCQPYLVHSPPDQKIIDFLIQQNFISIVTIPQECKYNMKEQVEYWNNVKDTVRSKFNLKKYRKINTEVNFSQNKNSSRFSTIDFNDGNKQNQRTLILKKFTSSNTNRYSQSSDAKSRIFMNTCRDDKVSRMQYLKKSKQKYMQLAKSQEKLFTNIMKPMKKQRILQILGGSIPKREYKKSNAMLASGLNFFKVDTQRDSYSNISPMINTLYENFKQTSHLPRNKIQVSDFTIDIDDEKIDRIKRKKRQQQKKLMSFTTSGEFMKKNKDTKSYQDRLQEVLQKKKYIETMNFNDTMKKLQQNSLQYRMKKHMQIQKQKLKQKHNQILKNALVKFLVKSYVVKMIQAPLPTGRQIKIQNFARNLKLQRIEKNIRKIFTKAKVKFGMRKLKTLYFSRFVLLMMQWKKYVQKFRNRKILEKRKFIVEQLTKNFVKDKMKLGVSTWNLNIRKIQKFRQWLVLVKTQRMKCLKYLWKVHLFSFMKINSENQNVVVCHLPKNLDEISFEILYNQKVQQNPNLKLETFLNKSPLFKIKVDYFRSVVNLFTQQKKPLHKSQKMINYFKNSKKMKIKFFDSQQDERVEKQQNFKINILSTDIYPYSLHYNVFTKPKNYDIAISQVMKKSQKWKNQQKLILQKILQSILIRHELNYRKKSRQYDVQLAQFIKNKFDVFCEKRWKFIIEYNQIQKTISKKKKQKQLSRIMDLIGMKKLLDEDCLPEKQTILDEALKRKDAPSVPKSLIIFGQKQFRQIFKIYYQSIYSKVKQLRKNTIN